MMKRKVFQIVACLLVLSLLIAYGEEARYIPKKTGGDTSTTKKNKQAYTFPVKNISTKNLRSFFFGNSLFNTSWTTFPSSVPSLDGLGPLFNRASCSSCHLRDGRGRPALVNEDKLLSILFKVATVKNSVNQITQAIPHPNYGGQLQNQAIRGVTPEGTVVTEWITKTGKFSDGKNYTLRYPQYKLAKPKYPNSYQILLSARVAPAVIGMGLLEAIPESEIITNSTKSYENSVTGRYVYTKNENNQLAIGRFGWKANVPTVKMQVAVAAINDMGLTSPVFKTECAEQQRDCLTAPKSRETDILDEQLNKLSLYSSLLGVPERRNYKSPQVKKGETLFKTIRCNDCHKTVGYLTGTGNKIFPELRNQTIYPLTDLLLHDMGDDLDEFGGKEIFIKIGTNQISSREWRTPPLWGIGLVSNVNQHSFFLHDGRARNLEEAILWHGGEASYSKNKYINLHERDRNAIIKFLESL